MEIEYGNIEKAIRVMVISSVFSIKIFHFVSALIKIWKKSKIYKKAAANN